VILMMGLLALQAPEADFAGPSKAQVWLHVEAWRPWVTGSATIDDGRVAPSRVKLGDDLDLAANGVIPVLVFGVSERPLKAGRVVFGGRMLYWGGTASGGEVQDSDEVFDGTFIPAGTRARSTLELDCLGLDAVGIVRSDPEEMLPLDFQFSVGVRYIEADLQIRGGGLDESQHIAEGFFRTGLRIDAQAISYAGVFVELGYGWESNDWMCEGNAGLRLSVGALSVDAGYRFFKVSDEDKVGSAERNDLELWLAGPSLAVVLRF
jgi:hypothetical protein